MLAWHAQPVPYTAPQRYDRAADFERGLQDALSAFLDGAERPRPAVAVFATSSGYSYPSFTQGVRHTAATLSRCLPGTQVFGLSGAAELVPAGVIADEEPAHIGPIAFSNASGAAHLARRMEPDGTTLAVDNGGSTAGATPIVDGVVHPAARSDPASWTDHRTRHGGLTWMGLHTTPLEALASQVQVGQRTYPVIPRGVPFEVVSVVLDAFPAAYARKRRLFGLLVDREQALRGLADALGVDRSTLTDDELIGVAQTFWGLALDRLAHAFSRSLASVELQPPEQPDRAVCFGLSAAALTSPALQRAGVPEDRIQLAATTLGPTAARQASSFGACHAGLEKLAGGPLPVELLRVDGPEA